VSHLRDHHASISKNNISVDIAFAICNLKSLTITESRVTAMGLSKILSIPNLRRLYLHQVVPIDLSAHPINNKCKLESLEFCHHWSDIHRDHDVILQSAGSHLQRLTLWSGLHGPISLPYLEHLWFHSSFMTCCGPQGIEPTLRYLLPDSPRLRHVHVKCPARPARVFKLLRELLEGVEIEFSDPRI
jgi:hypothetical protein